ncbi:flavin reductase [Streptomyces ruber]|uniref:Flavin reductase n=2 Tax=Streptomyces TaxID=1883 RepID=A0A918ERM8_9ACTN|nr:flavin reductase family protein [Streptomyces ruber]GGQ51869.1 flavin reductase [Streptomyces ruber]
MRVDHSPESMDPGSFYRLLTAVIVPRPIAWVSTLTGDGRTANLAPHSFFTVASTDPPIVQFTSVGRKDSLRNVEETGEFVVNFTPEPLFEQINATATDFPGDEGEFEAVGIEREPSLRVRPPRVAASPVALECTLHATLGLGNSTVVFGRVVHAVVSDDVLVDGRPDIGLLRPLARLGGNEWGTVGEVHDLARIRYRDWASDPARRRPDENPA